MSHGWNAFLWSYRRKSLRSAAIIPAYRGNVKGRCDADKFAETTRFARSAAETDRHRPDWVDVAGQTLESLECEPASEGDEHGSGYATWPRSSGRPGRRGQ